MYAIKRLILTIQKLAYILYSTVFSKVSPAEIEALVNLLRPLNSDLDLERVGGENDGGYLLPSGLKPNFIVSPGVSATSLFELHYALQGAKCYLFDYSVEQPTEMHKNFEFMKKYWGLFDDKIFIDSIKWMENHIPQKTFNILQMDIEGAEIELLKDDNFLKQICKFDIAIIEFHQFEKVLTLDGYKIYSLILTKLKEKFDVLHFHGNNNLKNFQYKGWDIVTDFEVTLINKQKFPITTNKGQGNFDLHILDRPNVISKRDVKPNW
jgi:hypothetical protein